MVGPLHTKVTAATTMSGQWSKMATTARSLRGRDRGAAPSGGAMGVLES